MPLGFKTFADEKDRDCCDVIGYKISVFGRSEYNDEFE